MNEIVLLLVLLVFFLSLLSFHLIKRLYTIKKDLERILFQKELYFNLFRRLPSEVILLKGNQIFELNHRALENLGTNPSLSGLKERLKKRGKYYEIIEVPLEKDYKILYFRDITERESLKEAYQVALSYLSHELKTPVAIASGYLQNLGKLLESKNMDSEVQETFEKVNLAFKNLEKLLRKLFSSIEYLAKDIKFAKEPFDLREAIEEAVFWVSPLAEEKKVTFEYQIAEEITLYGSLELFIQCLFNLIENAVKASPEGNRVIIRAYYLTSDKIFISIRDFGPGVLQEKLPFLGKPFFKLSEGEGMGLGLFIAKRIVEAHQGELNFRLPEGGGLEINIIIPVKRD